MKKYYLMTVVLLLFAAISVKAQNEDGKVFSCYKSESPFLLRDKFSVFTGPGEISQFPRFEIPVPAEKLSYNGHEIETHAFVSYKYIAETGVYEQIKLHIFIKPTDTDGLSEEMTQMVTANGRHNTVIIHNLYNEKGSKHKLSGEADVYARAFRAGACAESDMANLAYDAKIDISNPEKSTINYKISKSAWRPADKPVEVEPNKSGRFYGLLTMRLHDCSDILMNGKDEYLKNGYLMVLVNIEEKPGAYEKYVTPAVNKFGNLRSTVTLSINGTVDGKDSGISLAGNNNIYYNPKTNMQIVTENSTNNDEITVQQNIALKNTLFPFTDKAKFANIDCRMHGKLRLVKFGPDYKTEIPNFLFERASFSCMIRN